MKVKSARSSKVKPTKRHRSREIRDKISLPLDYPWKVLMTLKQDLAPMLSTDDDLLLTQIIRDRDHYSLQLLADDWSLQNTSMALSTHISRYRARYQLGALLKKFQFNSSRDDRIAMATEKFRAAERSCQDYNRDGFNRLIWAETEEEACVYSHAKSFIQKVLRGVSFPSHNVLTSSSRHGPGSNLDTCSGNSSIYFKYENWPYSCTKSAVPYARYLIQTDARWLGALEDSYRRRYQISPERILNQEVFWSKVIKIVEGNRITFVPKDARTERTIAIEPAMNLMLQLGVDGIIRQRLKRWGIDLDSQNKNQEMARLGSLHGSFSTIDLAAASDSIALQLCEWLLPEDLNSYLLKLRSPKGVLGGEIISYEKISSMGNGYTFAIESLIFAALCYGVVKTRKGQCNTHEDFAVFGDDIIIHEDHAKLLRKALSNSGFRLNFEKSFISGFVKESCGSDWVSGKPVRPVFLKRQPVSIQDLFVDINRLKRTLELRFGLEKTHTEHMMRKWIPRSFRKFTGPYSDEQFDSYLHVAKPSGDYSRWLWKYLILTRRSKIAKGNDFLFRKLMHDLRSRPIPKRFYDKRVRVSAGGSRFTVYKSYSYTVRPTYSVADHWRSTYAETGSA